MNILALCLSNIFVLFNRNLLDRDTFSKSDPSKYLFTCF